MLRLICIFSAALTALCVGAREKWTEAEANAWYENKPFMAGCNFVPSDASNQIEMWSSSTFNPKLIDAELAMAQKLGFNTMRVFLSDVVWRHEGQKFFENVDKYLQIADSHGIKTLFVFFDSCWNSVSKYGKQPEPKGTHNSNWLKSPPFKVLADDSAWGSLEKYVKQTVSRYADDQRVIGWDVFNEPGNIGISGRSERCFERRFEDVRENRKALKIVIRVGAVSQSVAADYGGSVHFRQFSGWQSYESDSA